MQMTPQRWIPKKRQSCCLHHQKQRLKRKAWTGARQQAAPANISPPAPPLRWPRRPMQVNRMCCLTWTMRTWPKIMRATMAVAAIQCETKPTHFPLWMRMMLMINFLFSISISCIRILNPSPCPQRPNRYTLIYGTELIKLFSKLFWL